MINSKRPNLDHNSGYERDNSPVTMVTYLADKQRDKSRPHIMIKTDRYVLVELGGDDSCL